MSHTASCAVFDPTPGVCDCNAGERDIATRWFHHLRTKAGFAPGYDKDVWRKVRDQLLQARIINH